MTLASRYTIQGRSYLLPSWEGRGENSGLASAPSSPSVFLKFRLKRIPSIWRFLGEREGRGDWDCQASRGRNEVSFVRSGSDCSDCCESCLKRNSSIRYSYEKKSKENHTAAEVLFLFDAFSEAFRKGTLPRRNCVLRRRGGRVKRRRRDVTSIFLILSLSPFPPPREAPFPGRAIASSLPFSPPRQ